MLCWGCSLARLCGPLDQGPSFHASVASSFSILNKMRPTCGPPHAEHLNTPSGNTGLCPIGLWDSPPTLPLGSKSNLSALHGSCKGPRKCRLGNDSGLRKEAKVKGKGQQGRGVVHVRAQRAAVGSWRVSLEDVYVPLRVNACA